MALDDIHVGDSGTNIDLTVVDDGVPVVLDPSDLVTYLFKRPDATTVTKTGLVLDGPNGVVRYTLVNTDINQTGHYSLQLSLNILSQGWAGHSSELDFIGRSNLVEIPFAAPDPPLTLSGNAPNYFTANMAWLAPTTGAIVDGYSIYRSLTTGGPYIQIATTVVTSYSDTTLVSSTNYFYIVRSFNIVGESVDSNEINILTPVVIIPDQVVNVVASAITKTTMTITWDEVTNDPGVAQYQINYTNGGLNTVFVNVPNLSVNLTGLTGSTVYTITVEAINVQNIHGTQSAPITPATTTNPPNSVLDLIGIESPPLTAQLDWTAPATDAAHDPAATYSVQRRQGTDPFFQVANTAAITYNEVRADGVWDYKVIAQNTGGDAATGNEVEIEIGVIFPPNAVTDLDGVEDPVGNANLTWSAPPTDSTHEAAATYSVERRENGSLDAFAEVANTANLFYVEGRPNGFWDYRIIAQNNAGNALPGNEIVLRIGLIFPPNPATNLVGIESPIGTALLTWDASVIDSTHDVAESYSVQRRDGGTVDPFVEIANITILTYSDIPGPGNFDYQIVAENIIGDATNSNQVNVVMTTFTTAWRTSNTGPTNDDQVKLPLIITGSYNFTVDWGDGSTLETITAWDQAQITHTFLGGSGDYTVGITGQIRGWQFFGAGDAAKLIDIEGWGPLEITTSNSFNGCTGLIGTVPSGEPSLVGLTDLTATFKNNLVLTGGVSDWSVSNITIFNFMFENDALFNEDISGWDISSGVNFQSMFFGCSTFNQAVNTWSIATVATNFDQMFRGCVAFNQVDFTGWDVSNATGFGSMFKGATSFNGDFTGWDTSSGTTFVSMFEDAVVFTGIGIEGFTFPASTSLALMFKGCLAFNKNISTWDLTPIVTLSQMLEGCVAFNQPIGAWGATTANVQLWTSLLKGCTIFNQPVGTWDLSSTLGMQETFSGCIAFNQPLSGLNVSTVQNFSGFLQGCVAFNQDLSTLVTTALTDTTNMFNGCTLFNSNISGWNMSSVTLLNGMLKDCVAFKQDLGAWDVGEVTNAADFLDGVDINNPDSDTSTTNYDNLLIGWAAQSPSLQDNVNFDAPLCKFSAAASAARSVLITTHNWIITDAGGPSFNSQWNTNNTSAGSSTVTEVQLPLVSTGNYNFNVDWGDGTDDNITVWNQAETLHDYTGTGGSGTYSLTITGTIEGFVFGNSGDRSKITLISAWGELVAGNLGVPGRGCFYGCNNLLLTATDTPDMTGDRSDFFRGSGVVDGVNDIDVSTASQLTNFFFQATSFNASVSNWDASNSTDSDSLFFGCTSFNQSVEGLSVEGLSSLLRLFQGCSSFNSSVALTFATPPQVVTCNEVFNGCTIFNQPLTGWEDLRITSASAMFTSCIAFNQSVNHLDMSACTTMANMFVGCSNFNQPVNLWDTSLITATNSMFQNSGFAQSLAAWNIGALTAASNMMTSTNIGTPNYDATLAGWAAQTPSINNSVNCHFGNAQYTIATSQANKDVLAVTHSWTITDGGGI